MRMPLVLVAALLASHAVPALAQQKEKAKIIRAVKSRDILAALQTEVGTSDLTGGPVKFTELLEFARENLMRAGKDVTFAVDEDTFRDENLDLPPIMEESVRLRNLPAKTSIDFVLRQALKQLPMKAAIVVRAGRVDIVPLQRTAKEFMLNQTFRADFKDQRLDAALEELSDLTGVSIVMDARVKDKVQTPVTARFNDDVGMQDAVRMLTEMAELKMVYLVSGIFITTPDRAKMMQKELNDLYEPKVVPPGGLGGPMGIGPGPMVAPGPGEPWQSPLTPPLPPPALRGKRLDPAA